MINIYINFEYSIGLSGGANSFLRNLINELQKKGLTFVKDIDQADLIFLNATHCGKVDSTQIFLNKEIVKKLYETGKPIVHRKTNNLNGGVLSEKFDSQITYGDKLQLDFDKFVKFHIFQSQFSLQSFTRAGFKDKKKEIISNGVNTNIFNFIKKKSLLKSTLYSFIKYILDKASTERLFWRILAKIVRAFFKDLNFKNIKRSKWEKGKKFKGVITTWSDNPKKIDYNEIKSLDSFLQNNKNIEVNYVGRIPKNLNLKRIKYFNKMKHEDLAEFYKEKHFYLTFNKDETCSNALIEALACGLPVIYKPSGSNAEIAKNFGCKMSKNWEKDFHDLMVNYEKYYEALILNHSKFSISTIADKYMKIFYNVHINKKHFNQ